MKMTPVLYSPVMIESLAKDFKTMTRRLVKADFNITESSFQGMVSYPNDGLKAFFQPYEGDGLSQYAVKCPYGEIGDILWVKEVHYAYGNWIKDGLTTEGKQKWRFVDLTKMPLCDFDYKFTEGNRRIQKGRSEKMGWYKRSSLFMPKIACRTFLKITDIRVERIRDISEADCIREGVESWLQVWNEGLFYKDYLSGTYSFKNPYLSIGSLWVSINGQESWDANPWVWCISFEKCAKPQ